MKVRVFRTLVSTIAGVLACIVFGILMQGSGGRQAAKATAKSQAFSRPQTFHRMDRHKVNPPLGATHVTPGGGVFRVRVTVDVAPVSEDAFAVELWTNAPSGSEPAAATSVWRAVRMNPVSNSVPNTASFEAALSLPTLECEFEYTARWVELMQFHLTPCSATRLVAFDTDDVVHFAEGKTATVRIQNVPNPQQQQQQQHQYHQQHTQMSRSASILAWLNKGNASKNASVVVVPSFQPALHIKDLFQNAHASVSFSELAPDNDAIAFAGTIDSDSLDNVNLQLNPPSTTTFALQRRTQNWIEPAHGKSGWPDSAFSREVYLAGWAISQTYESVAEPPLVAILIPVPPLEMRVQPDGRFGIAPAYAAHLWPHEDFRTMRTKAVVAVARDSVEAVQFIMRHFKNHHLVPPPKAPVPLAHADSSASDAINEAKLAAIVPKQEDIVDSGHETVAVDSLSVEDLVDRTASSSAPVRFYDRLGWCTWNSFYQSVNESDIRKGLEAFKAQNVTIDWLLIDDGWQITKDGRFEAFGFNASKFPSGYSVIKNLKRDYHLSLVGVWHSLVGYWGGIDPDGPIAKKYGLTHVERRGFFRKQKFRNETIVVDAVSYPAYYTDFHKELKNAGVDFFKVDDQSTFEAVSDVNAPNEILASYQQTVIQESTHTPVIWCMAHNLEVFYQTLLIGFDASPPSHDAPRRSMRASDDFFPDDPNSHTWHILSNAFNSLLIANLNTATLMDWDMFQSKHAYAQFHAIARALSNGPVYLSDVVGNHDQSVLAPLLASDGRVVRVAGDATAPMPLPKSLLANLTEGDGLLFLESSGGGSRCAVVGIFHCGRSGVGRVTDSLLLGRDLARNGGGISRWGAPGGGKLALAFYSRPDEIIVVDDAPETEVLVTLEERGADVLTIAPLWKSGHGVFVGCLGLEGKYYGAAAVRAIEFEDMKAGGVKVRLDAVYPGNYTFFSVPVKGGSVYRKGVELKEGVTKFYL